MLYRICPVRGVPGLSVVKPTGNFNAVTEVFDNVPETVKLPETVPPVVSICLYSD